MSEVLRVAIDYGFHQMGVSSEVAYANYLSRKITGNIHLREWDSRPIVVCVNTLVDDVICHNGEGVNVLWGDGHVKWISHSSPSGTTDWSNQPFIWIESQE